MTQEDKIRKELSDYLEFNSDEMFQSNFNIIHVFGGAIRDILCGDKINDVDILCGSRAAKFLKTILESNGYVYIESLQPKDLSSIYSDLRVICEPHSYVKGSKVVQIIRPAENFNFDISAYRKSFSDLISNVDMSCCGVSYDGSKLNEDYPNAILHCQSKVFSVNKNAKMYSEKRFLFRKYKLEDRGWKEVENTSWVNRDLKMERIFNDEV